MSDLEIRPLRPDDEPAVLGLMTSSLGWVPDGQHEAFFRWKHEENPAGQSPGWVALDGGRLAGVRLMMRWNFVGPDGPKTGVRAVDTATDPDYRGKGIFRTLTRQSVEELTTEGVDFVFNTPNEQSRPGYLKMGWSTLGRAPVGIIPRSPAAAIRIVRSRVPADLWSRPTDAFPTATETFEDGERLSALLASQPSSARLQTDRTLAHLRWRYGFSPLHYRVALVGGGIDSGLVVFRLRERGAALEAAICEVLAPPGARLRVIRTLHRILRRTGADYAIAVRSASGSLVVPLPRQGPIVTRRPLADPAVGVIDDFDFALGDLELF